MSQSLSRRSFLKCAGSGAVSLAAALLTGVSAAAAQPRVMGQPALLDGKAAVELLGYAPAPGLGGVLVYLSVENLSARTLPVGASYLHSRDVSTLKELYSLDSGVTARCGGRASPAAALRHRSTRRTPPMPRSLRSTSPPGGARCSIASAPSRRIGRRWS